MSVDHRIINGDCAEVMASMESNSVDAIVTDPPYGLAFMGVAWDTFNDGRMGGGRSGATFDQVGGNHHPTSAADQARTRRSENGKFQDAMTPVFEEALRVAKPGAHLLCFGGTRTFHRLMCAIEDAGWDIRDTIMWVYGSGFPKSLDVGKAIDKALGAKREQVRIPASEVRNPKVINSGHGIDGGDRPWMKKALEVGYHEKDSDVPATEQAKEWDGWGTCLKPAWEPIIVARKPLEGTVAHNVMTYGTGAINIDGCRVGTEDNLNGGAYATNGTYRDDGWRYQRGGAGEYKQPAGRFPANLAHDGSQEVSELMGDAQRFFYCAKASKRDRGDGNDHPTVKPNALMRWLVRLVCPQGGIVLDPFMGSGSTGVACMQEGMRFVGIEREKQYAEISERRIDEAAGEHSQGSLF